MSGFSKDYEIILDRNNNALFTKLLYWLHQEKLIEKEKNCILETVRLCKGKYIMLLIPNHDLSIHWKNSEIKISYRKKPKTVHSKNYAEFRFDHFVLKSTVSQTYLTDFLIMLEELEIMEKEHEECCKFIWIEDEHFWKFSGTFKRLIDTLYLSKKYEIVNDLDYFLNSEETYNLYKELCIPYKRIYLLHGLPGTGKSSLIASLATHFNYNVSIVKNVLSLDDNSLESMIGKLTLRKKTFLVFEDIDCLFQQREAVSKTKLSFSGLLNLLDGINNYDKLVIFITTNYIDKLDPSLKRRVDKFVELGFSKPEEICQMFEKFFKQNGTEFSNLVKKKKITANALEKYFIHCLQRKLNPMEQLEYIDEYSNLTKEHSTPVGLYS